MTRAVCVAAFAALLVAFGGSSQASSHMIVLDRAIGPVSLREPRDDVERALGAGVTIRNDQHYSHEVRYPKAGLDVFYAPGPMDRELAFAILTTSRRYRTSAGVGVGSSRAAVEALDGVQCYGPGQCQHGASGPGVPGTAFASAPARSARRHRERLRLRPTCPERPWPGSDPCHGPEGRCGAKPLLS
jgi:hypothetical protein